MELMKVLQARVKCAIKHSCLRNLKFPRIVYNEILSAFIPLRIESSSSSVTMGASLFGFALSSVSQWMLFSAIAQILGHVASVSSGTVCSGQSLRTRNARVVSSNPASVTIRTHTMKKATGNHFIQFPSLEKT